MRKELLPTAAVAISVFGRPQEGGEKGEIPEAGFLQAFLERGTYHARSPRVSISRELRARAELAARRWKEANPGNGFDETPLDPEREAELDGFREESEALQQRYARFSQIEGAMLDENGRILLWRLLSPVFLQLECRDGLCFLELEAEKAVTLVGAAGPDSEFKLPELSPGKVPHFRSYFPATGDDQELSLEVVRAFLQEGRPVSEVDVASPANPCRFVTTHWLDESRLRSSLDGARDSIGNPIVGGLLLGAGGSFACIFPDQAGRLWRAELLTDAHLKLTDRRGHSVILEHPNVLAIGYGRETKAR